VQLGRIALALWLAAIAASGFVLSGWVNDLAEGIAAPYRGFGRPALAFGLLALAIATTVLWARGQSQGDSQSEPAQAGSRRRFLVGAIAGGLAGFGGALVPRLFGWGWTTGRNIAGPGLAITDPDPREEWKGARVNAYRTLGRTNFAISDISLGSSSIDDSGRGEAVARLAIERGVNYFDTAPDYSHAGSETALGRAMKGLRDQMFVATKFCWPDGHLGAGAPVADYVEVVEGSLRRLQTDYVDLVHVHSCDNVARLLDPNLHEAFERLKGQGKVRFLGFSSHTPNLPAVSEAAIADGRFDVMMLAYHYGAFPALGSIIQRAAAAGMGVVAMKTLKGAHHRGMVEFREDANAYSQAAFKWVLSNPDVSGLVISFSELQHVDEYLYASGAEPTADDLAVLRRYDERIAGIHCFQHCGACLDACPEQLPIADVLRHRMYFEDYGAERMAMELYSKLEPKADVCTGCSAPCANACPFDVSIAERTRAAHEMLTLRV